MRDTGRLAIWSMVLVMALSLAGIAQEGEEQRDRLKEIMKKQEQGLPLDAEEMQLIERARGGREGRGPDDRFGRHFHEENPFADLGELNVVDQALYAIAQIFYEKGEYENAVKELAKVAADTPDEHAKSGAHLVAGHIYRQKMDNTEKAIEEYKQVTGDLADRALRAIVKCYEDIGEPDNAAQVLEDRLAKATLPSEKAMILNEIGNVYRRDGNLDKAIEALRRIPQMITYEEAEAIRKDTAERRRGFDFGSVEKTRQKIAELRAEGKAEEADRLEQKIREMGERFRGPMGRGEGGERPLKQNPAQ